MVWPRTGLRSGGRGGRDSGPPPKDAIRLRIRPPLVVMRKALATAWDSGSRGMRRSAPTVFWNRFQGLPSTLSGLRGVRYHRECAALRGHEVEIKGPRLLGATLYSDFRLAGEGREAGGQGMRIGGKSMK